MAPPSRFAGPDGARAAQGWVLERRTRPSRLFGANGLRTGADGRIYVAQVAGSAVTALDPDSGAAEAISAIDGPITAPDDIAFDSAGNLYATEITLGRVSMLTPGGDYRVIHPAMPVANPITVHQDRLFAGECRVGGRVFELDRSGGGAHREILSGVPMPNAFSIGPDGMLYMPIMATNEIWRVDPAGGEPEVVAGDLGVPDSVKFDARGRIVSTQVASGQVLRIDPRTGAKEVLAQLAPGLDNCTFVGERLFVSSIPGEVTEILPDGCIRPLVERGLQWPMGLAVAADGALFVADGGFAYLLDAKGLSPLGHLFSPGFPGFTRGVASAGEGEWLTTNSLGAVMRWWPAAGESEPVSSGYEVLYGVACGPKGEAVFADGAAGRVLSAGSGGVEELASGLDTPMGVAVGGDGTVYVSESGGGRVVRCAGGKAETVIDGLGEPQGIAVAGGTLFVADVEVKQLVACDLASGRREVLATGLPVKAPPGVTPRLLGGVGDMSGPMVPFCGVAVGVDGTVYVSADAEGSVLALRPA